MVCLSVISRSLSTKRSHSTSTFHTVHLSFKRLFSWSCYGQRSALTNANDGKNCCLYLAIIHLTRSRFSFDLVKTWTASYIRFYLNSIRVPLDINKNAFINNSFWKLRFYQFHIINFCDFLIYILWDIFDCTIVSYRSSIFRCFSTALGKKRSTFLRQLLKKTEISTKKGAGAGDDCSWFLYNIILSTSFDLCSSQSYFRFRKVELQIMLAYFVRCAASLAAHLLTLRLVPPFSLFKVAH